MFLDNGYLSTDAYHYHVLTAWIPLLNANENNGCMQVIEDSLTSLVLTSLTIQTLTNEIDRVKHKVVTGQYKL